MAVRSVALQKFNSRISPDNNAVVDLRCDI